MRRTSPSSKKKNTMILSASEIGQYTYCAISWYLQRLGYQPDSPALHEGKMLHRELGNTIDNLQRERRRAWRYVLLSVLLLIIAGLVFVFVEVIL